MVEELINLLPNILVIITLSAVFAIVTKWIWILLVVVFSYFSPKLKHSRVWHGVVVAVLVWFSLSMLHESSYHGWLNLAGILLYLFLVYCLFSKELELMKKSSPSDNNRSEDELL